MLRLRWFVGSLVLLFAGCTDEDSAHERPQRGSLGTEIFSVLCDRVGAQALREDLTGASYQSICRGNATTVDVSRLPSAADSRVRERGIAKIEALARHRTDLIAALDVVFPDDTVVGMNLSSADPAASCDERSQVRRSDQLRGLLQRLLPTDGETVPASTRALARTLEPLTTSEGTNARVAMTHLAARRGYMSPELATGFLSTVLTAPRLRDLLGATTHLFSPDASPYDQPGTPGPGYAALQEFVAAAKEELSAPVADDPPLRVGFDSISGRTVISRPRTTLELVRTVLLTEDQAFSNGPPLFVVRRDPRGWALVSKPSGKLAAPFVDRDGDGLADLDPLGRFVVDSGERPADPFVGERRDPTYEYVDARATALSAMVRHLSPLADPDGRGEALLSAFEGLEPLLRNDGREALLDLVHAAAQAAADPAADDALALFAKLFAEQPQVMARVLGNLLDAVDTLDAHPEARIPTGSTLVDELLGVLVKIGQEPELLEDILASMADQRSLLLPKVLPPLLSYRDRLTYDRRALNGLPVNITTSSGGPPETPVDRTQPNRGWNRSLFQRFLQMTQDGRGVTFCNKEGAILRAVISLDGTTYQQVPFPFGGTASECSLLKVDDISRFYLRSIVGEAQLHFRNDALTPMVSPEVMYRSTGIQGFWPSQQGEDVRPRPEFLNRLVFFDVVGDSTREGEPNFGTNQVISDLQGPHTPSSVCAARTIDDPNIGDADVAADKKIHNLRTCKDGEYLDQRDGDTLFALEYFKGYEALSPLTAVFVKHNKEDLLLDLLGVIHHHWSVEGGVVNAEPALAEILGSDLIPSLVKLTEATKSMTVTRCAANSTSPCDGASSVPGMRVLADAVRTLVDPARGARSGLTDRRGRTQTANGKALSVVELFRSALRSSDAVLDKDPVRQQQWKKARSRIVDEFLSVNGRGPEAAFADPGIPRFATAMIDVLRAQRVAKCNGSNECPALRQQLTKDVETSLASRIFGASLDMVDLILKDPVARREIGLMTTYMTRQDGPSEGMSLAQASSTAIGPKALDQTIAAAVDALGALGDLRDIRPLYPVLVQALGNLDPQLALLSRINGRAHDDAGREICARELDPEETIRNTLARLALPVAPEGQPKRSALQIFLDTIADVNRVDPANAGPLEQDDYANVFKNVNELLTDPSSGLEQLYAIVREATVR